MPDQLPEKSPAGERGVVGQAWRRIVELVLRLTSFLGPYQVLALTIAVGAVIAAVMTALAAEVYEAVTQENGVALLDRPILDAMLQFRSPAADSFITYFTNVGGVIGMPLLALGIMVLLAVQRRSWTPVILIAGAGVGSLLMTVAGKQLIGRTRPPELDAVAPFETSPSFPSGHTLNATVVAGIVVYVILLEQQHRRLVQVLSITLAAVFALTMGMSRVFLGHHWFTDVVAAWLLGLAWLAIVITAHRLLLNAHRKRESHPKLES
ncbi:phosphatase PAP2 family protein [Tessaracoccus sp. OS52]|uniref:phosphatase PAP2 family protein n=1 Tax=Tessaracoccus sp. OS52 TaxID=2886691 RepID=UPI001D0F5965|nr:phosphatase PAP2 family protein [Tessaracoccus sp. OS52]MCC2594458.1 phosphatase PAP2 family protein [Tessaracoccus sp. OS52]